MKKILITGNKGYIGQHLVKMLEPLNYNLYLIDSTVGQTQDITIPSNFYHYDSLRFDAIIHLAALVRVGESVQKPLEYYNTNINGTLNILKSVNNFDKFIFASTGAASLPTSPYAYSKLACEQIIQQLNPNNHTIFRFYNVMGTDGFPPTNPDGLFSNLIKAATTGEFDLYGTDYNTLDGTCLREYVHVNDICKSIIKAIDMKPTCSIENLAYGAPKSVMQIIQTFKKVNNVDFKINLKPRRSGDLEKSFLNNPSKLMERNYTYEQMLKF
jgi:UDP-glucose 4-epimerase